MKIEINKNELIILKTSIYKDNIFTKLRMLLDTGANYSIISPYFIDLLGYKYNNSTGHKIMTGNGSITAPLITIESLKIHSEKTDQYLEINKTEILVYKIPFSKIDGVLGINFLKHFNTLLALKDGYIEII